MNFESKLSRRDFMILSGTGSLALRQVIGAPQTDFAAEIHLIKNETLGLWVFDPVGVYLEPGQKVKWVNHKWGCTVTAYHPENENRELRIPEDAQPFHSRVMGDEWNTTFEWQFDKEGTYDYFSLNQEVLGMVGRIIVGRPGGPGEKPPGYGGKQGRHPMYKKAIKVFEYASSKKILEAKSLPFPQERFGSRY